MTNPQFHAIIAVVFILHLIQVMALAEIMKRLNRIEETLENILEKDKTIAEGLTDPIITCGGCGKEYQETGYVYGLLECPHCGYMNWVEKAEAEN